MIPTITRERSQAVSTYSTDADVERRMGTDVLAAVTKVTPYDATEVEQARTAAYGKINGKIGVRYQAPIDLAAYPELADLLRDLELDLVEWSLWSNVRSDIPPRVQKKRDAAWEMLTDIAAGRQVLPSVGELPPTTQVDSQAKVVGPERVCTRDDMSGMF